LEGLQGINASYEAHSREMEELLLGIETANQAHEYTMSSSIEQVGKASPIKSLRLSASRPIGQLLTSESSSSQPKSTNSSLNAASCGRASGKRRGRWSDCDEWR
jgi:hypothetical protein